MCVFKEEKIYFIVEGPLGKLKLSFPAISCGKTQEVSEIRLKMKDRLQIFLIKNLYKPFIKKINDLLLG